MEYLVIYEKGDAGYGAYVPDLPGCVAVGKSRRRVEHLIRSAIAMHLESMREYGEPIPEPTSSAEVVRV
jgi:predicted RNase H-like HicB family nuclease